MYGWQRWIGCYDEFWGSRQIRGKLAWQTWFGEWSGDCNCNCRITCCVLGNRGSNVSSTLKFLQEDILLMNTTELLALPAYCYLCSMVGLECFEILSFFFGRENWWLKPKTGWRNEFHISAPCAKPRLGWRSKRVNFMQKTLFIDIVGWVAQLCQMTSSVFSVQIVDMCVDAAGMLRSLFPSYLIDFMSVFGGVISLDAAILALA